MNPSQNLSVDEAIALLDAVGGEQIIGSGFEAEEADPAFAAGELAEDESATHRP